MSVTPYMGLLLPTPSVTSGPLWATQEVTAYNVIDGHTHLSGSGVPIVSAALNINADLPFNAYNATLLRTTRFSDQTTTLSEDSDLDCVYSSGGNLYWNNGDGTPVQITDGTSLAATSLGGISGLSGTTGSASFSTGTSGFTWLQDTNLGAYMYSGPIVISDVSLTSGHTVTIKTSNSLAASYILTLPTAVPVAKALTAISTGGQLSYIYPDNTSIGYILAGSVFNLEIKDSGISTAKIADGAVTQIKLGAANTNISASTGALTYSSGYPTQAITNMSVTLTPIAGRPVIISCQPDGTSNGGYFAAQGTNTIIGPTGSGVIELYAGATLLATFFPFITASLGVGSITNYSLAPSAITYTHLSPGTSPVTYTLKWANDPNSVLKAFYLKMVAVEL